MQNLRKGVETVAMQEKKEEMYTCGRTVWEENKQMRKNGTRGNARIKKCKQNKKNAHGSTARRYVLRTNRGHVSEFSPGLTMLVASKFRGYEIRGFPHTY